MRTRKRMQAFCTSLRAVSVVMTCALLADATANAATAASAVTPGQQGIAGAVGIPHSHELRMRSSSGRIYRIFVAQPTGPAPAKGYPVIYVLDANAMFGTVAEAVRLQSRAPDLSGVMPAIVVGIGYPGDADFNAERRWWDFTPVPRAAQPIDPGVPPVPASGGAEEFLAFIEKELKPRIAREFVIDRGRQVLFGHSLGGYFALHVLFRDPQAFDSYIASSPSLWWDERAIFDELDTLVARREPEEMNQSLLLSVGQFEHQLGPLAAASADADRMRERIAQDKELDAGFERKLEALERRGLRVRSLEIEGEDHISVIPVVVNRALRFALAPQAQ
jgi:predicted alpha/beta superfamily hydrolase